MATRTHLSRVIVVYESEYGQTHKIATYCADLARGRADDVHVMHVSAATDKALRDADVTIVLAPIYYGRPPKSVRTFVLQHRELLSAPKGMSAFFTVSGSGGSKRQQIRRLARATANDFIQSVAWQPNVVATFGGALAYPKYNPLLRFVAKALSKRSGGPVDTSCVYESTDWTEVERVIDGLLTDAIKAQRPQQPQPMVGADDGWMDGVGFEEVPVETTTPVSPGESLVFPTYPMRRLVVI